jgi:hypothetical protein
VSGVTSLTRTRLSLLVIASLILGLISLSPAANSLTSNLEIQAITDSNSGEVRLTFNSKIARASVRSYQITATPNTPSAASYSKTFTRKVSGYVLQRVTSLTPGTDYKFRVSIRTTNNRVINSANFNFYTRSIKPTTPVITRAFETDSDEAVIYFDAPANDGQTPVLYYTAKANPGNATGITLQRGSGSITITELTKSTTYTFTVTAHNINGTSVESKPSLPVTTLANKIIRVAPASSSSGGSTLAAPAFTLSLAAETKTVGILSTGYSITETGGTATYAISPALPAGLSFSSSNGLISGRATETRTATTHTITATNATGSASRTLSLRVNGDLGDIGPGGGRIFYYSAAGFNCGTNFTDTGSATGEKCKYLEVAPSGWANGGTPAVDPTKRWSKSLILAEYNRFVPGVTMQNSGWNTTAGVGLGYKDSLAIVANDLGSDSTAGAAGFARTYSGGDKSDWYLPSPVELNLLCQWARGVPSSITTTCTGGTLNSSTYGASAAGLTDDEYWSSTQDSSNASYAVVLDFGGSQRTQQKFYTDSVRPIRAF